jgi:hypothetical protein
LIDKFEVFLADVQLRNNGINICHCFAENNAIINVSDNNAVLPEKYAFVHLALNEVPGNKAFTKFLNQL